MLASALLIYTLFRIYFLYIATEGGYTRAFMMVILRHWNTSENGKVCFSCHKVAVKLRSIIRCAHLSTSLVVWCSRKVRSNLSINISTHARYALEFCSHMHIHKSIAIPVAHFSDETIVSFNEPSASTCVCIFSLDRVGWVKCGAYFLVFWVTFFKCRYTGLSQVHKIQGDNK